MQEARREGRRKMACLSLVRGCESAGADEVRCSLDLVGEPELMVGGKYKYVISDTGL